MLVYLDGAFLPREQAKVSVDDRGFLFGDGVYEVSRAIRGRVFAEEAHWARLARGLRELGIEAAGALGEERLREITQRLLAENGWADADATVYVQVTRGAATRTHWFPPAGTPATVYVAVAPFHTPRELRDQGAAAITHPDIRWSRCDLKTVNLLPNVVSKQRAREAGVFEAVLLRDGAVTEGASTNVFGVLEGELRTYPRSNYILPGVTRDIVIELARERGYRVSERPIFADELPHLQELFLTGTTTDVQPVVRLDGRPVGDGRPGPVARALQHGLAERMGLAPHLPG